MMLAELPKSFACVLFVVVLIIAARPRAVAMASDSSRAGAIDPTEGRYGIE